MPRWTSRLLLVVPGVLVVLLTLGVAPASAHAALDSTTPAQGSELSAPPQAVTLVFSEDVGINAQSLVVTDTRGHRVDDGRPQHHGGSNATVQVRLPPGLGQGSYTVTWRAISADGHPVSGIFAFGVGVPAGAVQQAASVNPVVGAAQRAAQTVCYAGCLLIVGASAFLFWLWPGARRSDRLRRVMTVGVAVGPRLGLEPHEEAPDCVSAGQELASECPRGVVNQIPISGHRCERSVPAG